MKHTNRALRGLITGVATLATAAMAAISTAPHAHAAATPDMCRATAAAGQPDLTAVDDTVGTVLTAPATIPVLAKVSSVGAAIDPTTLQFFGYASPTGGRHLKSLYLPGQGSFSISAAGVITFVAATGFAGTTTPVCYKMSDVAGESTAAYLTVRVQDRITSRPDQPTIRRATTTAVNVLANDSALTPFVHSSVTFSATGQPAASIRAEGGRKLTVPGQAVYLINAATGKVTVFPNSHIGGRSLSTVRYGVSDTSGAHAGNAALRVTISH